MQLAGVCDHGLRSEEGSCIRSCPARTYLTSIHIPAQTHGLPQPILRSPFPVQQHPESKSGGTLPRTFTDSEPLPSTAAAYEPYQYSSSRLHATDVRPVDVVVDPRTQDLQRITGRVDACWPGRSTAVVGPPRPADGRSRDAILSSDRSVAPGRRKWPVPPERSRTKSGDPAMHARGRGHDVDGALRTQ